MWKRFIAWLQKEEVADFRRPPDSPYHPDNKHMLYVHENEDQGE